MKSLELTDNARAVLSHLSDGQMHTVAEVAEQLSMDKTTARRILNRHYVMALVDESKDVKRRYFRITRKGRKVLMENSEKKLDLPSVPGPGELIPYLRAMSESLARMADRLSAYE